MSRVKTKLEGLFFKLSFNNIFSFSFIWLLVGFSSGTGILMGPVRWITDYTRNNNWSDSVENLLVRGIIILFVIFSFLLALWIVKYMNRTSKKSVRIVVFTVLIVLNGFVLWIWLNPEMMNSGSNEDFLTNEVRPGFYFGVYPTQEELVLLKEAGFNTIVSLLHPAVLPFETKLIADEKKNVQALGMELIHIPMLPWVSDNESVINEIKKLIRNKDRKYYVHCYLGKDRVNVFKRIVVFNNGVVAGENDYFQGRKLEEIDTFERGKIIKLEDSIYFTPFPTDEEYFGYILSNNYNIVSLLNPDNPADTVFINKEQEVLMSYNINFNLFGLKTEPYDPDSVIEIVKKVKEIPKPLIIHAFFTRSPESEAFVLTYTYGITSLPPILFEIPMLAGEVTILAVNAIAGGIPKPEEFRNYLYYKGVRNIAFTGTPNYEINQLKVVAENTGLTWNNFNPKNDDLADAVKAGGTWYLFGSDINMIKEKLKDIHRIGELPSTK